MLADVYGKPDSPKEIMNAFQTYDKTNSGLLDVQEMKHVLTRVGDVLSPQEVENFMSILDVYGDGCARMDDLVDLLKPQSGAEIYSKAAGQDSAVVMDKISGKINNRIE